MELSEEELTIEKTDLRHHQAPRRFLTRVLCRVEPASLRLALFFLLLTAFATPALAADPSVSVELNKLEPHGGACRAYLVLESHAGTALESLKLDLVMFDGDGVVARRLAVEAAPLPAGKTSLKVFDVAGQPCDGIGRILLNDVLACRDAGGVRKDCLDLVAPSARGSVPFIK
jgi:hypothetical protein